MAGRRRCGTGREPCLTLAKRFSRVSGTRHKVSVFKVRERREPFGLSLAITLAIDRVWRSRVGSGTLENTPVVWFGSARTNSNGGGERMLLYEMVIAIGIAVVLVVAAIGVAARVMMGPEEMALLRAARAGAAQRRLMAAAAQQERDARAAAAQRRLMAAAAQQDDWIRRCLERLYEDALAAPLSPRLATLITQLETQAVSA